MYSYVLLANVSGFSKINHYQKALGIDLIKTHIVTFTRGI